MKAWSLGARLTFWSAIIFTIAGLLLGAVTTWVARTRQIAGLDIELAEDAVRFFDEVDEHKPEDPERFLQAAEEMGPGLVEQFADADGHTLYRSPELGAMELAGEVGSTTTVWIKGERYRLGVFVRKGARLYLGDSFEQVDGVTRDILYAYLVGLPLALLGVIFSGRWLARKALAPVEAIAAAAERITAERLDQRLPVPPTDDEMARLARVLNATFDRLDASFRQAVRFSADASHELKTPLALLGAGLESLMSHAEMPLSAKPEILSLLDDTRRLAAICKSLLLLSRADAGHIQLDLQPCDIRRLVEGVVEDAHILAEPHGITISSDFAECGESVLDARFVSQILLNVLDNAVKYNRPGGSVRVSLAVLGEHCVVRVANTGDGISAEHAARIFERFYRVEASRTERGHGLGLSLSRELARAHKGELTLEPSESGWTIFQLLLPHSPRQISPTSPGPR